MDFKPDKAALWRAIWKGMDGDPTDDALCLLAVEAIEPLIDLYWVDVVDEFEAAVVQDSRLRKALSCCDFDTKVPPDVRERLYGHVRPQDDIGHQPAPGVDS